MSSLFQTPIAAGGIILLGLALLVALGFEFVNGFHDTANAVATVIYTKSLKPIHAVMWSGLFNLLGVLTGGIAVAMGILKLLPVELLSSGGSGAGLAMVLALLIGAILWNLGTWYFGLPASSSHTLIGAIVGVGLANSLLPGHVFGDGVNWVKVREIGLSLVISPLIGFGLAALVLLLTRKFLPSKELHDPAAEAGKKPPGWIRGLLVLTCTGVSYAHGSNDGQKGIGLVMLILIGLLPADYALNRGYDEFQMGKTAQVAADLSRQARDQFGGDEQLAANAPMKTENTDAQKVLDDLASIRAAFRGKKNMDEIPAAERFEVRSKIIRVDAQIDKLIKSKSLDAATLADLKAKRAELRNATDYSPRWVMVAIAIALGLGTMIGWKRIVVTVGEKIGKSHLTYAQGASAELVAMTTIGASSAFGLPVSTTHVLSSGIAGTMAAQKSGLQTSTVRNIALAWILTLPASMILGGGLFLLFRAIIPNASAATLDVHYDKNETVHVVASASGPLRLHGSSTVGAELAPALAEGFLRSKGVTEVGRAKGKDGHAWVVTGTVPGDKEPTRIEIDAAGSATGFTDLAAGNADVAMASRGLTDAEKTAALAAREGDLSAPGQENVIGLDGIAVVVNPGNATRQATLDQLAALFSGETAQWPAEAGVNGDVHLYARDEGSGTLDTFRALAMSDKTVAAKATRLPSGEAIDDAVARDPLGVGFVPMSSVKSSLALAISDSARAVAPTVFSVKTEEYPLSRRLYLYLPRPAHHPLAEELVHFALTAEGQRAVSAAGFVDLRAGDADGGSNPCAAPNAQCPADYASAVAHAKRVPIDFRFDTARASLDSRGERDVNRLTATLRARHQTHVLLFGFSDGVGPAGANVDLSTNRAKQVAGALTLEGIVVDNALGFGAALPVASDRHEAGRERNRRVEVWIPDGT